MNCPDCGTATEQHGPCDACFEMDSRSDPVEALLAKHATSVSPWLRNWNWMVNNRDEYIQQNNAKLLGGG